MFLVWNKNVLSIGNIENVIELNLLLESRLLVVSSKLKKYVGIRMLILTRRHCAKWIHMKILILRVYIKIKKHIKI